MLPYIKLSIFVAASIARWVCLGHNKDKRLTWGAFHKINLGLIILQVLCVKLLEGDSPSYFLLMIYLLAEAWYCAGRAQFNMPVR